MMHGREKSDSAIVAGKPTNKAVPTAAEPVAPRAEAKGNASQGRHAPIAAEDQARVIVGMFAKPDAHAGKTCPLFGPVELTHPQIAQIVGRVLRKEVKYQQVTMEKLMEVLSAQPPLEQNSAAAMYRDPASQGGRPNYVAQHLHEVAIDHANGVFAGTNNHVLEIGGRAPLTVEAFVDKHRAAFL